jgi:hypothetical protein
VEKVHDRITFVINRDLITEPASNARSGGPSESVQNAIIKDACVRAKDAKLRRPETIAALGTCLIFRHIPNRYNGIQTKPATVVISDDMVWSGCVDKPDETNEPHEFPSLSDARYANEATTRVFPAKVGEAKTSEQSLPVDHYWKSCS